jgi:uncharacterized caspase-like protein
MWLTPRPSVTWCAACLALSAFLVFVTAINRCLAEEGSPLKGVALVIGQSDYENIARLPNPENDARAVEEMLDSLGFETDVATDRDARKLKRDLEGFVEDADDADVAIIYYSGHGIEAGGENYLVPVDADAASLEDAGDKLVPLSEILDELKKTVPVTIVLLDACRNDPFPPGTLVKASPDDEGKPIGAGGLGETRSVVALGSGSSGSADQSIGQVIGFAAEPGKVALDGDAGANSPYAAAILRHLGAMEGQEFGIVLRMIGEEVYLKTSGQQRPWVNESLRRLLYFGRAPEVVTGEEGDILKERRRLLVSIAELPDFDRRQIEAVARDGGVPMDALYGMLKALGSDAPKEPAKLDKMLRSETARLKELLTERSALKSPDPEIIRLSKLADEAISEGALSTALRLHEQAKKRVKEMERTLEQAEADLKARVIEAADVYARSAAVYEIAFDHRKASADYLEAFRKVERWDDHLAWKYKTAQAKALIDHGEYKGDNAALAEAAAAAREALGFRPRATAPDNWATTQTILGSALWALGERESGTVRLEEAVTAFRAALEERTRDRAPLDWTTTQNNLGIALQTLGERENGTARLEEAVAVHRAALEELTRERVPLDWATAQTNLGTALWTLGTRESGTARLEEAVAAYRAALEEFTRGRAPLDWATTQNNLGNALWTLGTRESGTARLEEAVAAYRAALVEYTG